MYILLLGQFVDVDNT